jgi:protein-S-isoprenylcysteine O-methyltransferase Ste14
MSKVLASIYAAVTYLIFLGAFLYAIGFVGNYLVPKSIDSGKEGDFVTSVLINLILLGLFAVQHSLMARPFFKRWWRQVVPPVIERSTYVLFASLLLILLFWQWLPLTGAIWSVTGQPGSIILQVISLVGWLIVLTSTFMINHFDLFGLRQAYLYLKGEPYHQVPFTIRYLYHFIRHPIMLGFIIAFWATPQMTVGHLLFAIATTSYILIGIQLEERDLLTSHREEYRQYRQKVSMLVPLPGKSQPIAPSSVGKTTSR